MAGPMADDTDEPQITQEMVDAGVDALYDWMGYQLEGDVNKTVREIFRVMYAIYHKSNDPSAGNG